MRGGLPHIQDRNTIYFRDIYDHLVRVHEGIETARDLLANCRDAWSSTIANRTNDITKQLTIFATIFLPLSFITGFFGQNFDGLGTPFYFGVMWVLILALYGAALAAFLGCHAAAPSDPPRPLAAAPAQGFERSETTIRIVGSAFHVRAVQRAHGGSSVDASVLGHERPPQNRLPTIAPPGIPVEDHLRPVDRVLIEGVGQSRRELNQLELPLVARLGQSGVANVVVDVEVGVVHPDRRTLKPALP